MRPTRCACERKLKHVVDDHVQVVHRLYRGKLDRPKSERSKRTVALSLTTRNLMAQWRQQPLKQIQALAMKILSKYWPRVADRSALIPRRRELSVEPFRNRRL